MIGWRWRFVLRIPSAASNRSRYQLAHLGFHSPLGTGDRLGKYSIRVNEQWRICFRWVEPNADDVEIVDYH